MIGHRLVMDDISTEYRYNSVCKECRVEHVQLIMLFTLEACLRLSFDLAEDSCKLQALSLRLTRAW